MTIRNTATDEAGRLSVVFGGSGAIESQEAQGQQQLTQSSQLPTHGLTKEMAEKHGIAIVGQSAGDPLFQDVVLPDGWKIQPTDHSMWSDLLDASGQKVAGIFYKAAFYDRCASIRFTHDD